MPRQLICSNCGATITVSLYESNSSLTNFMRAKSLCFDCAFWTTYTNSPRPNTAVISGRVYTIYPHEDLLFSGVRRRKKELVYALDMQTKDVIYAYSPVYIAKIPERFRKQLPDKFRFISEKTYLQIIKRGNRECTAKGCWDRYRCFWYNKEKMEPDNKPYNIIPHYHNIGDEECESFIDIETMYNVKLKQ